MGFQTLVSNISSNFIFFPPGNCKKKTQQELGAKESTEWKKVVSKLIHQMESHNRLEIQLKPMDSDS